MEQADQIYHYLFSSYRVSLCSHGTQEFDKFTLTETYILREIISRTLGMNSWINEALLHVLWANKVRTSSSHNCLLRCQIDTFQNFFQLVRHDNKYFTNMYVMHYLGRKRTVCVLLKLRFTFSTALLVLKIILIVRPYI